MDTRFRLWPEDASSFAPRVDQLYMFLLLVAAFFTALICVLILYFAIRYRRTAKVNRKMSGTSHFWAIEIAWSVVPLILTMIMFYWGADLFIEAQQPPANAVEVDVIGKQWMWKAQHPDGQQEINSLHVPVGRPVKLRMISEDVIHSFYVPAFRLKQDVLPGRYTEMWFEATKPGRFHLFCAEYCGTSHSGMIGEVVALEPADYAQWMQGGKSETAAQAGERLFQEFRCGSCHRGEPPRCPPLEGVFGREVQLMGGEKLTADEAYLRESILNPAAKVVAGYQPVMPTYQDQISEADTMRLIAYLKTLKSIAPQAAPTPQTSTQGSAPAAGGSDQP